MVITYAGIKNITAIGIDKEAIINQTAKYMTTPKIASIGIHINKMTWRVRITGLFR